MALQNKVFVGSLPNGTKPEALRHLFEKHGEVVQCDVVNRCGFVYMQTPELVTKCVAALNGTEFNGEKINVEVGRCDKKAAGANAKRTRRGSGKMAAPRVPGPPGPVGVKKRIPRGRGGGPNQGMFPSDISPDVKEAVTMRLAGAIMELMKENQNALFDNRGDMQGAPNPRQQYPQGGNFGGGGGPNKGPRGNKPRQTGGPPTGNRADRPPPKQTRNEELFTRRPTNEKAKQPTGLIKGKVTTGPPVVVAPKPDTRRRGNGPNAGPPNGRPGPRPNGQPRGNDGFGHNNGPNMNFSNGPNRSGGHGRNNGAGGGGMGGNGRGDGGNNGSNNNNQFYSWRNDNMNGRSNGMSSGGSGGGGGGGAMNRGFTDNFGGNSNSMFNQGGGGGVGGGSGSGGMGQDRRGFALPGYQQQQQHHQPSAFLQSNFDNCLQNPGGFTSGVSSVVSGSGGGGMGGGGSGFSYSSSGQNMSMDNRGVGGFRSSSGFLGSRGMGNTTNGDSGFGGYDNNTMSRGNYNSNNSNNNNTQMYQDDFPPLNGNRSSGNMPSSGGFNQGGGMNSNNMNRNIDPWQSMHTRHFN